MTMNYAKHLKVKDATQGDPVPGKQMVPDSDGCFVFAVDKWKRLDRFLVLGCEGGSYYAGERELTKENADAVLECLQEDGARTVQQITVISEAGRAPKNDAAIFALAMACSLGNEATKSLAFEALPKVVRTGGHLLEQFMGYAQSMRGWGRGLRKAVAKWYTGKDADQLAYQLAKYRQREGWSHRDVLRLTHPKAPTPQHQDLFFWLTQKKEAPNLPTLTKVFLALEKATSEDEVILAINEHKNLSWEMIPSQFLSSANVWDALLPNLPYEAMTRNLGRMTANGLLAPMSDAAAKVVDRLGNVEALRKSRLHPIAILKALLQYQAGRGSKGGKTWEPVSTVVDALDKAFYAAFGNVTPTGMRYLLALDVSGSMEMDQIAGVPGLTPRSASAAMALVTAATEKSYHTMAFCDDFVPINISPRQRMDDVLREIAKLRYGSTNCSLPMVYALEKRLPVDVFVVYTDSETNHSGSLHPFLALQKYRKEMGIQAKLVVVGMTANEFSIADPSDAGMLDVVGFDTATPELISNFATE